MAREKSTIEYQNVSMRIPKELYSEYKKVLAKWQYALENDERFGVWGGLSERQRRKLQNIRKRSAAA